MLYVSSAYEQIWGRTCASLYRNPMDWLEAILPEDRKRAHETFMRQLQGEVIDSEYRIQTPGGQERWISDRAFPIRDASGQLIRIAGIASEISERKQAEQALRTSEQKFRQLAENVREVFFIMNASATELLYVSRAVEEIWGVTLESLYQDPMSWTDAIHPDDKERARSLAEKQRRGEPIDSEFRILTPDGKVKWIHSRTSPVLDDAGELIRVVGIAEETTKQKRYESELISAREVAESASRSKSAFLAVMSHELRTPLNVILGFAEFLELEMEEQESASWLKDIRKIRKAGGHLLDLISDIMDLSKIEAGKMELARSRFDVSSVVAEVGPSAEALAATNQIRLHVRCEPVEVRADRMRFRQCLLNLVSNACKFTQCGEVRIEQSVCERDDGVWCKVRVVDTGIGIRSEDMGRIFEDFTQVDSSISRKYGGTGLGPPISRRLMQMMGGDITVESVLAKGSIFTLWLPIESSSAEPQVVHASHLRKREEIMEDRWRES